MNNAYLAGIVDSDGSLSINCQSTKNGTFHYRPVFQLTWKTSFESEKIINELYSKYGGSITLQYGSNLSKENTFLHYSLTGVKILKLLKNIKPFIIVKSKQLDICYELAILKSNQPHFGQGVIKSIIDRNKEKELYNKCTLLNSYGKSPKNKLRSKKLIERNN